MRDRFLPRRRRSAAAFAGIFALAIALSPGGACAEDDENLPWDVKIMRQFLKDLGLQRDGGVGIEYRERAPLVVPPSRNLPPPQDAAAATGNPAWPNDPDVRQRREEAAERKKPRKITSEVMEVEARPLPRSELERGRIPPGTQKTTQAASPEESARPMRPSELGSKSLFSGMFSSFGGSKQESAAFSGEPERDSLTAPPPGYQTPSASHPYGMGPQIDRPKAARPEDRVTGEAR
jgi:hypothetical protein